LEGSAMVPFAHSQLGDRLRRHVSDGSNMTAVSIARR
jgi:hypothetical protein